jgi:hypothetical protein
VTSRTFAAAVALAGVMAPTLALADEVVAADADADADDGAADAQIWEDEPAPLDPELDEAYPQRSHFAFRAQASGGVRALYDTVVGAAELEASFGADTKRGSFSGALRFLAGRTDGGLGVQQFTVGPSFAWNVGPVTIGPKVRIGYLWIDRVTSDDVMDAMSLGVAAAFGLELYKNEGVTVALTSELVADALLPFFEVFDEQPAAGLYGASLGLQFRLRAPKAPRASHAASR